ncbi:MAG: hypothetical protein EXR62_06970 [Chloroflexi bacterium]|nr:hypothetical protein [Chloroflexota bacterium]
MTYHTQSPDTSSAAEAILIAGVRKFTPTRRLQIMNSLTGSTRRLAWRQFRARHPDLPEQEVRLLWAEFIYGPAVVAPVRVWLANHQSK